MKKGDNQESVVVAIFGSGGVGKSALTLQFMYDEFVEEYEPTRSDSYTKKLTIGNQEQQLSIFDTAGQEDYECLKDQFVTKSQGFLCVFSVVDHETFERIDEFFERIIRIKGSENVPMMLVGNKIDLIDDDPGKRRVSVQEAEVKASKYLVCLFELLKIKYIETSAKTKKNVGEIFEGICKQVMDKRGSQTSVTVEKKKPRKKFCCF